MSNREFKEFLGFHETNNRVYEALRGEIKIYMGVHNINNRSQAGDANWRAMVDWVLANEYMRSFRQRYLDDGDGVN